jgi:hypothetical protein
MNTSAPMRWVEVRYTAEGKAWRQRHFYAVLAPETIVLVTAQGPDARAKLVAADAERVAGSIRPRHPG